MTDTEMWSPPTTTPVRHHAWSRKTVNRHRLVCHSRPTVSAIELAGKPSSVRMLTRHVLAASRFRPIRQTSVKLYEVQSAGKQGKHDNRLLKMFATTIGSDSFVMMASSSAMVSRKARGIPKQEGKDRVDEAGDNFSPNAWQNGQRTQFSSFIYPYNGK
ncbi:hypothetical protein SODALDRAFT_361606 [Sodiomyces alkalinus F11]|uniref:Uncharacterized protein n=1 Tax=Sodiomyces alkalinus (strain CBS 110278 / VKM F-3762 / F11) TaxID=1314773 RepID=A0A3N2PQP8_SODAK|nr:hypothetical protein SODALDRAFT_361606 [Sodiomyces alkalinus F11]ROT36784.1 hypothetical protein SODALDRAFT_361606 [Sodiomyces alkalinus F11]